MREALHRQNIIQPFWIVYLKSPLFALFIQYNVRWPLSTAETATVCSFWFRKVWGRCYFISRLHRSPRWGGYDYIISYLDPPDKLEDAAILYYFQLLVLLYRLTSWLRPLPTRLTWPTYPTCQLFLPKKCESLFTNTYVMCPRIRYHCRATPLLLLTSRLLEHCYCGCELMIESLLKHKRPSMFCCENLCMAIYVGPGH